ncbi:MAG: hypothetical protein ACK52W_07070 [Alphaproteobacteria bacterium]
MMEAEARLLDMFRINTQGENVGKNNILLVMARPGLGKTWLHHKIAHVIGCNHKLVSADDNENSDEFFVKPSLNPQNGTNLLAKINEALAGKSQMDASSIESLKKLLSEGKYLTKSEHDVRGADGKNSTVPADILDISKLGNKDALDHLKFIATTVGLISDKTSKPLLSMQAGELMQPLIHARDTGEPLLLTFDEANYYNWGPITRNLLSVIGGHDESCTIPHYKPDGSMVQETFTRAQLQNVKVLLTANKPGPDEPSPKEMAASIMSRIQNQASATYSSDFFAARLAKEFLGIPLTTHWQVDADYFAAHPEVAQKHFNDMLTKGLTAAELKGKDWTQQQRLLQQAGEVAEGCTLLGNVMFALHQICTRETGNRAINSEVDQYLRAVDMEKRPMMDGRSFNKLHELAADTIHNTPKDRAKGEYSYRLSPELREYGTNAVENLGSRMTNALLYWIDTNFPANRGLDQTRQHIAQILVENRVISTDEAAKRFGADLQAELQRAEPKGKKVAELINVNQAIGRDAELEAAQALLFDIAKAKGYVVEGMLPDQLFNKQAVSGMLDEYERLAERERKQPDGQIVMPDLVKEATGKFTLKVLKEGVRPAEGDYTKNTSPPAHMLEQQLLFMMTKHGGDLSEFFIKKPPADTITLGKDELSSETPGSLINLFRKNPADRIRRGGKAALPSDSSKTIASLKQGEAAQLEAAQSIKDEGKKQEAIARIKADFEKRIKDVTTKDYQKNYALVAGDHASGIGVATIILSVPQDKKSPNKGFTLLRDKDPADETSPPRYVLIGDVDIGEKVKDYLRKIDVEYVNTAAKDGPQQLNDTLRSFIGVGASRLLEKTKPDGTPLSDTEKVEAITDYETTWRTALADKFSLHGVKDQGTLLTHEAMDQLREAMGTLKDPEARYKAAIKAGVGVGEAAHNMHPDKPLHERILDRLVATTSFNITHGHLHPQAAAQITPPPQAMTR